MSLSATSLHFFNTSRDDDSRDVVVSLLAFCTTGIAQTWGQGLGSQRSYSEERLEALLNDPL